MTNYERIKNMSISELAHFLNHPSPCKKCSYYQRDCLTENCDDGITLWLLQEAKQND